MMILVPENSFKKKIEKWVKYKDFVIADATDRHDMSMSSYGNKISCDELAPTPTLTLIATADSSDKQAQIKRRRLQSYLDRWLSDEAVAIRVHYMAKVILKGYKTTGEDTNIFIVMRKPIYFAFHQAVEEYINTQFAYGVCTSITHKMPKEDIKSILSESMSEEYYKALKSGAKRLAKMYKIEPSEVSTLEDFDGIY